MNEIYLSMVFDGNVVSVMAATKSKTGVVTPLATESQEIRPTDNPCGVISVNDDNRLAVSSILRKILNKIEGNNEITGIYLGIMPRSMHGECIEVRRDFQGKHRITVHDIENLDREVVRNINDTVVAIYDNGFVRDGLETLNVRNELADSVVRKSVAVVVSPRHMPDLRELFGRDVRLHAVVPTQVAIARVVADDEQRVNGVMSFHIGNRTSGLTYMLNDMVMGTAVVPFGFDHILNDMTLGEVAVEKMRSFVISPQMKYKCSNSATIRFSNDGPTISLIRSLEAFNARIREIFSLGYDRILASLNLDDLKVPVLLTSSLINTHEFAEAVSDLIEQDCVAANASNVLNDDNFSNPKYVPLIALVNEATKPCIEEAAVEITNNPPRTPDLRKDSDKPKEKRKSAFVMIKEQLFNLTDEE